MKKGLIVAILLVICIGIAINALAYEVPAVCAWAGYSPAYAWQCIVAICMELWINPIDYLSGDVS